MERNRGEHADTTTLIEMQQKHIISILPQLIDMTEWNASLVAMMQSRHILSRPDVRTLEDLPRSDRTSRFFNFIHDRLLGTPDAYDTVIEAFEELCQTGVSQLLRQVYN